MPLRSDRHPSAFVLVAGILAVSLIGLIGALLARSHDHVAAADREVAHARAVAAAEAGLAVAVEAVRSKGVEAADLGPAERSFGDTVFTVRVNRIDGERVDFVARGESDGVARTVTASWRFDPATGAARRCHER